MRAAGVATASSRQGEVLGAGKTCLVMSCSQDGLCAPQASRYSLITVVRSNSSMAAGLAAGRALTGRWQTALAEAARVEALTAADVRDVAGRTFHPDNCFTGFVLPEARALG